MKAALQAGAALNLTPVKEVSDALVDDASTFGPSCTKGETIDETSTIPHDQGTSGSAQLARVHPGRQDPGHRRLPGKSATVGHACQVGEQATQCPCEELERA